MRILFAGATGVLGRATLPHLRAHEVVGLTRWSEKLQLLRRLGAEPELCDGAAALPRRRRQVARSAGPVQAAPAAPLKS